ncbi:circadian clock KaiB family protein [Hymenobacter sublimis]|uniref:Circadian clock KaiB family protein n=1 Tax=Hymenobacter sublimis TaxID=2933777 RepID=A0ABY4J7G6_9BACT|nr:circadian clock KaiB family protein [Hymenobacter sublimis]UPL47747.1 circadian clock KaiB family protein [Hymenobacter sublimis]
MVPFPVSAGQDLPLVELEYELHLFVVGSTAKSLRALANIQRICAQYLSGRHTLDVVDLNEHPERAGQESLLGIPCLVKKRPGLVRQLVGDLSDQERVLKALSLE